MHPDRLEIELFGTERNGDGREAVCKVGFLEQAHGGTLLLDEVADMPLETQGKIVRVLQEQTFERVGGKTKVEVDVRVIASTSRDLQAEMSNGKFRAGPVLSPERGADARAGPARAARRHPGAAGPFHARRLGTERSTGAATSATTRWRCCRPMTGRAMSASCATWSTGC